MELSTDHLKKLEAFLTQEMSDSEKKAFLIEIESTPALQEYLDIYEKIDVIGADEEWAQVTPNSDVLDERKKLFSDPKTLAFSEKLKDVRREAKVKSKPTRKLWLPFSFGAAAAAILLLLMIDLGSSSNLAKVYSQNSSWNELPSFVVKGGEEDKKLAVEEAFKHDDFSQAESLATDILKDSDGINQEILLYLGVAQLEQDKFDESLTTFKKLIESDAIDAHKGLWYTALVYIKKEDKEKAIAALEKVASNTSNYKYDTAKSILKELK